MRWDQEIEAEGVTLCRHRSGSNPAQLHGPPILASACAGVRGPEKGFQQLLCQLPAWSMVRPKSVVFCATNAPLGQFCSIGSIALGDLRNKRMQLHERKVNTEVRPSRLRMSTGQLDNANECGKLRYSKSTSAWLQTRQYLRDSVSGLLPDPPVLGGKQAACARFSKVVLSTEALRKTTGDQGPSAWCYGVRSMPKQTAVSYHFCYIHSILKHI